MTTPVPITSEQDSAPARSITMRDSATFKNSNGAKDVRNATSHEDLHQHVHHHHHHHVSTSVDEGENNKTKTPHRRRRSSRIRTHRRHHSTDEQPDDLLEASTTPTEAENGAILVVTGYTSNDDLTALAQNDFAQSTAPTVIISVTTAAHDDSDADSGQESGKPSLELPSIGSDASFKRRKQKKKKGNIASSSDANVESTAGKRHRRDDSQSAHDDSDTGSNQARARKPKQQNGSPHSRPGPTLVAPLATIPISPSVRSASSSPPKGAKGSRVTGPNSTNSTPPEPAETLGSARTLLTISGGAGRAVSAPTIQGANASGGSVTAAATALGNSANESDRDRATSTSSDGGDSSSCSSSPSLVSTSSSTTVSATSQPSETQVSLQDLCAAAIAAPLPGSETNRLGATNAPLSRPPGIVTTNSTAPGTTNASIAPANSSTNLASIKSPRRSRSSSKKRSDTSSRDSPSPPRTDRPQRSPSPTEHGRLSISDQRGSSKVSPKKGSSSAEKEKEKSSTSSKSSSKVVQSQSAAGAALLTQRSLSQEEKHKRIDATLKTWIGNTLEAPAPTTGRSVSPGVTRHKQDLLNTQTVGSTDTIGRKSPVSTTEKESKPLERRRSLSDIVEAFNNSGQPYIHAAEEALKIAQSECAFTLEKLKSSEEDLYKQLCVFDDLFENLYESAVQVQKLEEEAARQANEKKQSERKQSSLHTCSSATTLEMLINSVPGAILRTAFQQLIHAHPALYDEAISLLRLTADENQGRKTMRSTSALSIASMALGDNTTVSSSSAPNIHAAVNSATKGKTPTLLYRGTSRISELKKQLAEHGINIYKGEDKSDAVSSPPR